MPEALEHQPATNRSAATSERTSWRQRLSGIAYYFGMCLFPFSAGGAVYLAAFDIAGPVTEQDRSALIVAGGLSVMLFLLVLISGVAAFRRNFKRALFGTVWCVILLLIMLASVELSLLRIMPDWPASDLHGVLPEVARGAWGRVEESQSGGINDWGQRDRPRTLQKSAGVSRLAFIGDSFLEESTTIPLSLRVERKIGRPDVEILNLGVSATDPDEYCYRVKHVALPLECDHCVLFLFAGNDFSAPARTLPTFLGVTAVSPRGSSLRSVGLRGLNHLATNRYRPVLQTWFASGDLHTREKRLGEMMAEADDARLRDLLYSLEYPNLNPMQRDRLAARLNSPNMKPFFEMLRSPDQGLFRSYYLSAALWSASVGGGEWPPLSEAFAAHWIGSTHALCRDRGVEFTLVIIPEAFQVDNRMAEQWQPLTDMPRLTHSTRVAALRLAGWARQLDMNVIDLHDVLNDLPGTYLNLDGHWSDRGVEVVSDYLAAVLNSNMDARR